MPSGTREPARQGAFVIDAPGDPVPASHGAQSKLKKSGKDMADELILETLKVSINEGVIDLQMNRPDKLNAINSTFLSDLHRAIDEFAHRGDARVLVLSGAGKSFCAGFDVSQEREGDIRENWIASERLARVYGALESAPVMKIARVQGFAMGAGLILSTMCELRYATPDAVFGVPELDLGIPFSMSGVHRLARFIGITRTADMVVNCTRMGATEARQAGLVTDIFEAGEIDARIAEIAARAAARPALLLLETQVALREAGEELAPASRNDLAAMFLARQDPDCSRVGKEYANRFRSRDAKK